MTWARAPKALNNIPYCLQKTIFPRSTSLDIWKAKNRLKYGGESASHLYSRLVSHICSIHKYSLKCHRAVLQINVVTVGLYGETGSIQHSTPAILRNTFPVAPTGPDLPHLTEESIFNLHTYSGKDKSGQRKKSFICAVLGFFLTEKEINVATPLDANLHRRKKKTTNKLCQVKLTKQEVKIRCFHCSVKSPPVKCKMLQPGDRSSASARSIRLYKGTLSWKISNEVYFSNKWLLVQTARQSGCGTGAHSDAQILLLAFGARQCCLCLTTRRVHFTCLTLFQTTV